MEKVSFWLKEEKYNAAAVFEYGGDSLTTLANIERSISKI